MKNILKGDMTMSTKVKSLINRIGIEFKAKKMIICFDGDEVIGIEYLFLKSIIASGFDKIKAKMLADV